VTAAGDRSLKVWDMRQRALIDTHYGHRDEILGLDAMGEHNMVTCSYDKTPIYWKVRINSN
jgi:WD40 repeat protein